MSVQELFINIYRKSGWRTQGGRLEKELSKVLKESQDEELKQHLAQQLAAIATYWDHGLFTQKLLNRSMVISLGLAPNFHSQSASEQTMLQNGARQLF